MGEGRANFGKGVMDSETAAVLSAHRGGMGHRAPMAAVPSPHEADSFQTVRDVYCSISVCGVFVKVA